MSRMHRWITIPLLAAAALLGACSQDHEDDGPTTVTAVPCPFDGSPCEGGLQCHSVSGTNLCVVSCTDDNHCPKGSPLCTEKGYCAANTCATTCDNHSLVCQDGRCVRP